MCGIVGYSGKKDCVPFMMNGLSLLEYRGYDSAGIATLGQSGIEIRKEVGKLSNLAESLSHGPMRGHTGIGHTRWATHGKPSQENAHPHFSMDRKVCVVHNGIIENHDRLRKELETKGIEFRSQTDSEVVPQYIAYLMQEGQSAEQAFLNTLGLLEGAYALVMITTALPEAIFAARKGSPLIAGVEEGEVFLGSDSHPLVGYTSNLLYLDEEDVLIFNGGQLKLLDGRRKSKEIVLQDAKRLAKPVSLEGYESYTHKEIHEQPDIIQRIIQMHLGHSREQFDVAFNELEERPIDFKQFDRIYITGCGTAYHAAYIGKYYLEEFMDIPVEVILSSEFRYAKPKLNERNLVIAVSQSGETADTLASIHEAKKHGSRILSVVNVINSSIDRESHSVVYTHAGPEIGVASTKAFTSQVLTLFLLSIFIAKKRGEFEAPSEGYEKRMLEEVFLLSGKVRRVLDREKETAQCALKYHLANSALYLGRHLNFPIALEGALKNKEISYMHAEGYAAGEMKHGPIALIDKTLPVICVCTRCKTYDKMVSNIKEVEAREGILITVATEGDNLLPTISREVLFVPDTIDELAPILNVVALQLLAYYFARHKGCEIDMPRNLAKSVTVE